MADENQDQTGTPAQQPQILLDERDMRVIYANAYRIHTAAEEVVIDLGFNMQNPNSQNTQQPQLLFRITDRVIMSYPALKRMVGSLQQLLARYEQQFGQIPIQPGQKR